MAVVNNNVKQQKTIVSIPIKYTDLYNLDKLKEIVENHTNINKANVTVKNEPNVTNNNNSIDIHTPIEDELMDVYQQTWMDLRYKYLFDNQFELYVIWMDCVEEHFMDIYFTRLEDDTLTEFDIKNNVDYDNIWYHYCECGKNIDNFFKWINSPSEVEDSKPVQLSISDIYTLIDSKISQLPNFSIITPRYVILVAKSAKQIIELKGKVILPKDVTCRDTIYHHKKEGNLFVSIIDY